MFICGSEEVKIQGGVTKYTLRYDDETIGNFTATKILESFKSTIERCPVTTFNLVKNGEESKDLDQGVVTLDSDEKPEVIFNFKRAFDLYPKVLPIEIKACTYARECNSLEVTLYKITCDEASLLSDGVPIVQQVTQDLDVKIAGSAYKQSFLATNPKCPVTKFGLLWTQGDDDP